ncbi:MAG: hypothetical protein IPK32_08375 [Verrucomicrobiaceae bacterium]|nr:hypothetical protein [Verrucomicrobiaceae bacterium]
MQDLDNMLDGEKSDILRMLANLRKFTVKAQQRSEQRKERRKTKESDSPPRKPVSKLPSTPASNPDQLEFFE